MPAHLPKAPQACAFTVGFLETAVARSVNLLTTFLSARDMRSQIAECFAGICSNKRLVLSGQP
jgi:hypothetical protein